MLVVVSPAKRLDESPAPSHGASRPIFADQAAELAKLAARLSAPELEKLMHISPRLAALNVARFATFGSAPGAKPAAAMFAGDTYGGLEAATLEPDEMAYAQTHLRILSGLYGLLRPMDMIKPHRLQMSARLANARGRNLYEFWGVRIAAALNEAAAAVGAGVLVNCASVEYFKAVDPAVLGLRVVTPMFLDEHGDGPRFMAVFAKKARGAMARFIIQHRLQDAEALKDFDAGGYRFHAAESSDEHWVFLREGGAENRED